MKTTRNFMSVILAILAAMVFCFSACNEEGTHNTDETEYTVTFDYNYAGAPAAVTQKVKSGEKASEIAAPSRDQFEFTGWYTSADADGSKYDFSDPVMGNLTLYAGWAEVNISYTVTFDYNYEGAPAAKQVSVAKGDSVSMPEEPDREDALFLGWFIDKEASQSYDFSASVTEDITLYAGWTEVVEGSCIATFYLNDGTDAVYRRVVFDGTGNGSRISAPEANPDRAGYHFDGWFSEAAGETEFNFNYRQTESVNIYAKWRIVYTFEAELTYLEGKMGRGYSGQNSGTGLITADDTEHGTASGGYYVGWIYYNGASVDFEFEAAEAASDVTIVFRLSAEYDPLQVTGDQIYVDVNGTKYDLPLTILDAYDLMQHNTYGTRDFTDYTVAVNVPVQKGSNLISLVINNNIKGSGGTMYAAAPLVDCLYLWTNADLTFTANESNLDRFKA